MLDLTVNNPMRSLLLKTWTSPTLMSWVRTGIRSGTMLALLGLAAGHFSEQEMAVWLLFLTVNALQVIADAGLTPTFARMYAFGLSGLGTDQLRDLRNGVERTSTQPNRNTLSAVAGTAFVMYGRTAVIWAVVLAICGTWAMAKPVGALAHQEEGWWAWLVVASASTAWIFGSQYASILQGTDNVALSERIGTAINIAQLLTCVPVLLMGGGLMAFALAYNLWFVVQVVMSGVYSRRVLKSRYGILVRPKVDSQVVSVVWPAAWRSGVGICFAYGTVQFSGIGYAQFVSADRASSYLLALFVMNMVRQFASIPLQANLPRLARLRAAGQLDAMCDIARTRMRFSYWILVLGTVCVGALAHPLLELTGSRVNFVSTDFWALLMLGMLVERFGAMHLQLYSTTNHILWHWIAGISGTLFIVTSVLLYPSLGSYAFPTAVLVANLAFYSWYPAKRSYSALPMAPWQFERAVVPAPFLLSIVYYVAAVYGVT